MTDHTTHFDDCGGPAMVSGRGAMNTIKALEAERDALRRELDALGIASGQAMLTVCRQAERAEQERDALRLRVAELLAAIAEWGNTHPWSARSTDLSARDAEDKLWNSLVAGDTTALRAMLVEAALDGLKGIGYGSREADMDMAYFIADRILGASKEGGQ